MEKIYTEAHRIRLLYRQREIDENLRNDTIRLLQNFYRNLLRNQDSLSAQNISQLELPNLQILTMSAEILDIYSSFDKNLGAVFFWIKKESKKLYSNIVGANNLDHRDYGREPKLRLEQIRFAALHLIEKYRENKDDRSLYASEFQSLIDTIKDNGLFDSASTINCKRNVLSYLYFWLGKCHRSHDFINAKHCYENSESQLLYILSSVTLNGKLKNEETEEQGFRLDVQWTSDIEFDALEILRRISLVALAQAQLALMMGRTQDAKILVEKAEAMCAESDLLAKAYANFITGTCLRYLFGRKSPEETIIRLKSAYDVFIKASSNGIPQTRHIIRTMRELVLTLILKDELVEAKRLLDEVENKALSEHPQLKKLRDKYLWRFYNLSLRSRIARKEGLSENSSELLDKAIEDAKAALYELKESNIQTFTEISDGKFALGEAYLAAKEYRLAIAEFKDLIGLNSAKNTEQKLKRKTKTAEEFRRSYEHPEVSAICYLYLSRIYREQNNEEEAQKYSVKYREIEARGQIENSWILDLKEQIENDQKFKEEHTIKIEIREDDKDRMQSDEDLHTFYKNEFTKQMYKIALNLYKNNIPKAADFLGYEKSGFSHSVKKLFPELVKTRKRKSKQKISSKFSDKKKS